jgi:hypothetical protein
MAFQRGTSGQGCLSVEKEALETVEAVLVKNGCGSFGRQYWRWPPSWETELAMKGEDRRRKGRKRHTIAVQVGVRESGADCQGRTRNILCSRKGFGSCPVASLCERLQHALCRFLFSVFEENNDNVASMVTLCHTRFDGRWEKPAMSDRCKAK